VCKPVLGLLYGGVTSIWDKQMREIREVIILRSLFGGIATGTTETYLVRSFVSIEPDLL